VDDLPKPPVDSQIAAGLHRHQIPHAHRQKAGLLLLPHRALLCVVPF
jgi:hypothetical protein